MSVLVLAEAVTKPDQTEAFVQLLAKGLPETRKVEGCLSLEAYLEQDGKTVVAVESWQSQAHYEKYLAWRQESGALKALESLLEKPLQVRFLNALDV